MWAKWVGKADTSKLGITGFCWGGRITWTYCVHNPKAAVAQYGRLWRRCRSRRFSQLAPHLKVPAARALWRQDAIPACRCRADARRAQGGWNTSGAIVY
jgi:carboxymethylenebutenolidase